MSLSTTTIADAEVVWRDRVYRHASIEITLTTEPGVEWRRGQTFFRDADTLTGGTLVLRAESIETEAAWSTLAVVLVGGEPRRWFRRARPPRSWRYIFATEDGPLVALTAVAR